MEKETRRTGRRERNKNKKEKKEGSDRESNEGRNKRRKEETKKRRKKELKKGRCFKNIRLLQHKTPLISLEPRIIRHFVFVNSVIKKHDEVFLKKNTYFSKQKIPF